MIAGGMTGMMRLVGLAGTVSVVDVATIAGILEPVTMRVLGVRLVAEVVVYAGLAAVSVSVEAVARKIRRWVARRARMVSVSVVLVSSLPCLPCNKVSCS